ncbi:nickel-dependent hydrogenase large subunit [Desulfovibrio sulfodismutans]|uniref:Periplasmic [NiFe] hydrogenase large subunit n=2 Tax=Desulfolutivibrio sulfodismutans TaxID=63561 RepID=A0A7K3NR94_9BACT|nr:nickel-dependent hydrogenase large subunit [Desulfolutivibrio sulfodismutans]NDY58732.1 nickel-dependent hydrogenase large subunit [Desulfolutivibrio sulfodismutans]QLA14140.1 hydrogenase 2 large subunit [Desulfolutivibrio sulfodismutans DSM 3696]
MAESKPTPQSTFTGPVIVDPITRIEGHLRIMVEVENGKIKDAWSSSQLFRGLEIILKGRDPRDAQHFTQRACGVCTYVHALASTRCVDNAVKVNIPANARMMRNLVMAAQYLHDHIVHFYHLHALDWVDVTNALKADPQKAAKLAANIAPSRPGNSAESLKAVQDRLKAFVETGQLGIFTNAYFLGGHAAYYLPPEVDLIATAHYLEALHLQVKAARCMAVFGGKNPHTQFTIVGGCTNYDAMTPDRIAEFTALWKETKKFVDEVYIPDLLAVAGFYKDWGGIGGTTNFMSFGEFPTNVQDTAKYMESCYFPAGVMMNRDLKKIDKVDLKAITEHVKYSWYKGDQPHHPYEGVTDPQYTKLDDKERYSWMKAPRYNGKAMEVGPLARVLIAYAKGHKETKGLVDTVLKKLSIPATALFSTLGRTAARGIETAIIAEKMDGWIKEYAANIKKGDTNLAAKWEMPAEAEGVGLVDAPRGALSHWIKIKDKKIDNFQLVVPSTWNLGPRCAAGAVSPVEEALIGTPIADPKRPVEILRTVHAFDPCIACGVHVIEPETNEVLKFRIR